MSKILDQITHSVFGKLHLKLSESEPDEECEAYSGLNFQLGEHAVKFRKAKITPKKSGLFVTLWKRNAAGQTEPFSITEPVDFYIVAAEKGQNQGFFLFPKAVLAEKQILTRNGKEGKRGFRVYPVWETPGNKQAEKTQTWQNTFFIDLSLNEEAGMEKFRELFLK